MPHFGAEKEGGPGTAAEFGGSYNNLCYSPGGCFGISEGFGLGGGYALPDYATEYGDPVRTDILQFADGPSVPTEYGYPVLRRPVDLLNPYASLHLCRPLVVRNLKPVLDAVRPEVVAPEDDSLNVVPCEVDDGVQARAGGAGYLDVGRGAAQHEPSAYLALLVPQRPVR